jgi:hypothetical protein
VLLFQNSGSGYVQVVTVPNSGNVQAITTWNFVVGDSYILRSDAGVNAIGDATGALVSYGVVAAPEPSTWAMMMLGFAGLGFVGYRSRRATVKAV